MQPVGTALPTFEQHLERILQRWTPPYGNARMEGLNDLFQAARARARGYRNTAAFIAMIHLIAAPLGNLFNSNQNFEERYFSNQALIFPSSLLKSTGLVS